MSEPLQAPAKDDDPLLSLVQRLCDGQITIEERDQLENLLRQDRAARDRMRAYLKLHAEMQWYYRGEDSEAPGPNSNADEREPAVPLPTIPVSIPPVKSTSPRSSVAPSTPVVGALGQARNLFKRPVFWSILAVATVFYGGFTILSWNLRSSSLPDGTDGSGLDVATVSNSENLQWSADGRPHGLHQAIKAGEPLRIESGLVELQLKRGTRLLIQAPSQWTIDGANQATLIEGRLVAHVPQQAVGFELSTSSGKVIDLGTEFGVQCGEPGTEVHVFQGRVEVEPRSADAAAAKSRIKLAAGESVRLESSAGGNDVLVKKVEGSESGFVRSLAETRPSNEANRYARCVSALKPLVYFPISRAEGSTQSDHAQGRFVGKFTRTDGPGDGWESSPFGEALAFRGTKYCDRVMIEPIAGKADNRTLTFSNGNQPASPFTVALWARCQPGQSTGTLVGKGAGFQEQYLFDILNGKYRFVTISADRKTVGEVYSKTPFDGTWQHVAAVFDPRQKSLALYVNGKQEATSKLPDVTLFATDETTFIGNRPFRGDNLKLSLMGGLDEIAVFPRALTTDEIESLYRLQPISQ